MNNSCDIIKDLLPLYHDGVSSEDSNKIVKEHLENCSECRNYLDGINKAVFHYKNKSKEEEAKIHSLLKLRKKFRIKKIIIATVSILCAAILFFIAQNFAKYHQFSVSYRDDILSSEKTYIATDILQNTDYYCSNIIIKTVDEQHIAYIYYTNVLWNTNPGGRMWGVLGFDSILPFVENRDYNQEELGDYLQKRDDILENVSAIYYLVGDYRKLNEMPDEEFFNATKDAVLIWEK